MNTYEINDRNEVVPYTSGRRCTDTMAWRDATELELQQQDEIKTLETELAAVTEQRDRLAEALEEIMHHEYCCDREYAKTATIAVEALQSLNQDHTVAANDMISAVKGGIDE